MSNNTWIMLIFSALLIVGFFAAMASILRENRSIDSRIDYSKVRKYDDTDDEDDETRQ